MYGAATIGVLRDRELAVSLRSLGRRNPVVNFPDPARLRAAMASHRIHLAAVRLTGAVRPLLVRRLVAASTAAQVPIIFLAESGSLARDLIGGSAAEPTVAIAQTISEIPEYGAVLMRRFAGLIQW